MAPDTYDELEQVIEQGGVSALFDRLAEVLREGRKYAQLFDALLMKKRLELGLPLEGSESVRDLPEAVQIEVENYYIDTCRKVGGLYLQDGDIAGAWPYFRAIDEPAPVAEALDRWRPPESGKDGETEATVGGKVDAMIDIALAQGASPRRGFELLLDRHGVERAVEALDREIAQPGPVRERCGRLLVDRVHGELSTRVREAVAALGGSPSPEDSPGRLAEAHPGIFERRELHLEERQIRAAIRIAASLEDREAIRKAVELTEYARRLPQDHRSPGQPPFEDFYADSRIYLLALLGVGSDGAVRYFQKKAERAYLPSGGKNTPGEVLVTLLDRVGRHAEAVACHRKHLETAADVAPTVPKLVDLCQRAGDFTAHLERARQRGDLLEFAAGLVRRKKAGKA